MGTKNGLAKKILMCVMAVFMLSVVFTACELQEPITESTYYINDNQGNYYNKDHTTNEEAVDEFTDSITALRKYLDSESFVDSGYYMGVDFDIDILDAENNTAGNFALRVQSYLYTYPYEDEDGNPIYKYYENGTFYDENNEEGSRTLISALEIHNEAIKKSDISIEWYNGATNEVLIGLYFDGVNSNSDNPGNILYANIQGYKRSFPDFGDTVIYQQMIRLLVNLSVEGLLEAVGLQGDAGTGSINETMTSLIGENYKRVVNRDLISLFFYSVTLDAISQNVTDLLYDLLGVFGRKWDPMTYKFLGFKFSTVANAIIQTINADMQAIISPDKNGVNNVLTNAVFAFAGVVNSYDVLYTYTSNIKFDYGWTYPEELTLDTQYYLMFDYGNYEFDGMLYVPAWDAQFDAEIRTDFQQYDNSTNNIFMEFRDIANGELMIGLYYREERTWLDISGMAYMYGWVDIESLGFPQVYDEHIDLAVVLGKFFNLINNTIVAIVDSILDPSSTDKENKALEYILAKTSYSEKNPLDIFSINSETLQIDIELIKQMLEETGAGTYSTRQIINILDSMLPYTMDQIAIMLGIASAEIMLEKTYFTLTWDVDKQEFTIIMYTNVGVKIGEPSTMIFRLELVPIHFGEYVKITEVDFTNFKPLGEIYTYSGTLRGNFIFSSQETVDLSKLLSATIGESSGLNTPYVLAQNAGLSFTLIYDQFVKDQEVDGRLKKAGRSAFELTVWLTGSESTIIIGLASDDVCFDNEVYKDLPAREAELGYVWVNIECVTKNGVQVIPKVKIREDIFMASMSAYMNNETSIEDDVTSFADNDFNLSLTSIISALCKDAYVIAAAEQMEITSSNETLQNLFRVNGLIGNIKVDAGFDYRVKGLESIRLQYYMYEVGFFDNIVGNSPYDTALHSTLPVFFYEDYMDAYDPLEYDFLVYGDNVIMDNGAMITAGTIFLYQLGARRTVARQEIDYSSSSFFNKEDANNQDISRIKFVLDELVLNPTKEHTKENMLIYESEGNYYYRTYYGKQRQIEDDYIEVGADGTVYVYWKGISEVLFHDEGAEFYYFDRNRAIENENGEHAFIAKKTDRDLLFEYDPTSILITEDCKTQYAPRTNGSFMGEVRRYFITFESIDAGELGKIESLYYDVMSKYPQYYSKADEEYVVEVYDDDGVLLSSTKTPITLFVMEPCEPLAETVSVNVKTDSTTTQLKEFTAQFVIDWELASANKKGYMTVTEVIVAPGKMGQTTYPIRIIVINREVDTNDYVSVYTTEEEIASRAPVIDTIDVDPYDYAIAKYEYLSDTSNFNPAIIYSSEEMERQYQNAVINFTAQYFAQEKYAFEIYFAWQQSYLFANDVGNEYIAKKYSNMENNVYTRFNWSYDVCPKGSNLETSVSPRGGTIYLHTYFKGQLIALRANIGKREFSHLKFYDTDSFSPEEYNEKNEENDPYITGLYRGNYYDKDTYEIETQPIFVFTDGASEYEYIFDMEIITGLMKNTDGTYAGAYKSIDSYEITWGNPKITNVTSKGSQYAEYAYSYIYKENDFEELEKRYDALSEYERSKKVKVFHTASKSVSEEYLYLKKSDGRVEKRNNWSYPELASVLTQSELDGAVFIVEYGTGRETKYKSDRIGNAMIRDTDTEGDTVLYNRPFYYFYKKTEPYVPVEITEEQYELYINGDAQMRDTYGFNTDNSEVITTVGFDLYYLFRLYFSFDNKKYAISTLSNQIIQPENLDDQAVCVTDFPIIELRIEADCPMLEVDTAGIETDRLTGFSFEMSKVDAGDASALGYYKVDPLNAETLILPDSMKIYFKYEDFVSAHEFKGLEWCAYYDENGNPVYTYEDPERGTMPLINVFVDKNGKTRYKVAIDVETLTEELLFKAMVKIGNDISGYREITVAIRILSKDPTNVTFYVSGGTKLETPSTTVEIVSGDAMKKLTYYSYYANTFEDFKLPEKLVATFSDGHKQTYEAVWEIAKQGGEFVFAPNTIITLKTTIGTDGGVTVEIYLVVVVENYELETMEVSNEFSSYYVTVKNENGEIFNKKVSVSSLFKLDGKEMGYYYQSTSAYYVHISTGAEEDGDTPAGQIGLYSLDAETGRFIWRRAVGVYDFITALYSRATLGLKKYEINYDKQAVINSETSIFEHAILLRKGMSTTRVALKNASVIKYSYRPAEDDENVMTVEIKYIDPNTAVEYNADIDENGMLTISYGNGERRSISYAELASYIIGENMSIKYIDWIVTSVNGSMTDATGLSFGSQTLNNFVSYNAEEKRVVFDSRLGLNEDGIIVLKNSYGESVSMSYRELMYRMTHYYRYLRVAEGTTKTVANKNISIKKLYEIMDINDMLIRPRESTDSIPQEKYLVSLGTGEGSYDVKARQLFTGGFYLAQDERGTLSIPVTVYTNGGTAQYSDGYILGNSISASVKAIINDGTGATQQFNYNKSATDEKLLMWYVEIMQGGNPTNISSVNAGEVIQVIPAKDIYNVGKLRKITISALTSEGFRIKRTLIFEELPVSMVDGFSGGNPNSTVSESGSFAIMDGLITIENVYDYTNPSVFEYLGTDKYLPKVLTLTINGKKITVNNVKWKINPLWYGAPESVLSGLTYKGTTGKHVIATADILGYTDSATGNQIGTTLISSYITIKSAEVLTLPWETAEGGNGLATETLISESGTNEYRVYVDAYSDDDAVRKGAIKAETNGKHYLELSDTLIASYIDGSIFTFSGVKYNYGGTRQVTKIYFDTNGIDVGTMTSTYGDLSGVSTSLLSKRSLDLTVELGLEQNLSIKFWFYNKKVSEIDSLVYYQDLIIDDEKVSYSTLNDAQKAETVGTTDKSLYIEGEDGFAKVASLIYYRTTYYEDGTAVKYKDLSEEKKQMVIEGTEIKLFENGASGDALKAGLVYNDISAVIRIDDEAIRDAIFQDREMEINKYQTQLGDGVNRIRIESNLENIIASAQGIRSQIKVLVDEINISAGVGVTAQYISEKLLNWTTQIAYKGGIFDETALPKRKAYSDEESYNYALKKLKTKAQEIAFCEAGEKGYYVTVILEIINGNGSKQAKTRAIKERIEGYYEELVKEGYNTAIREYIEKEYSTILVNELNGFTKEEFNNAVYYKNMVEAGFDIEKAISLIYKLRSLQKNGATPELAEKQIDIPKAKANGYGFVVEYDEYIVNGRKVDYQALSQEQKEETVTFGTGAPQKLYKEGLSGEARVLTQKVTYDELAYAVLVQMVYEAYDYADNCLMEKNEQSEIIREKVIELFEGRLDMAKRKVGGTAYLGNKAVTYTFENFVSGYAYNRTAVNLTKKTMRAYLVNVIAEAMDFTAFDGSTWNEFKGLAENIVAYSHTGIANYTTTINSIRRSLISNLSFSNVLTNLLTSGIKAFTDTVYLEAEYVGTIKKIQATNGQVINVDRYGTSGYSLDKFAVLIDENTAKYLVEPYYAYRKMPHKIILFFEGNDREEDESGKPYITQINWSTNELTGYITYMGAKGNLAGVVESLVTGESKTIRMVAISESRMLKEGEKVITTTYIEDGLAYATETTTQGKATSDGRCYMIKGMSGYIYYYQYESGLVQSEYSTEKAILYTLKYDTRFGKKVMMEFSGYDSNATIVYSFVNDYDSGIVKKQSLFVYNPFEFDKSKDMPSDITVAGERMNIRWNNFGIQPSGNITNITDGSQQILKGKIESDAGQEVKINLFVAKWSYSGIYRHTSTTSGEKFMVEGEEQRFVYMNPLNFFFSAYSPYSPEDYYLIKFAVRIMMPEDEGYVTKRIIFGKESEELPYIGIKVKNTDDEDKGFVGKVFYPENSRLLEYGTDDDTMEAVKRRNRYVMYWDSLQKNRVISGQISQQTGCLLYLGNEDSGKFTLDALTEQGDTTSPTKAVYGCERMSIAEVQFVTINGLTTEINGNIITFICGETGAEYALNINNNSYVCKGCNQSFTAQGTTELTMSCQNPNCPHHGHEIIYDTNTGIGRCGYEVCELYNEIKDALFAQSGQASVVIAPDGTLPTTGDVNLYENNIKYRKDELKIRFLWSNNYEKLLTKMSNFVRYAYPEVEDSAIRNYSKNILMTWNEITEGERKEIIDKAKEYLRLENEYLGDSYTEEMCVKEANELLAIKERYDYSADLNRLRGGGNNGVITTVLIGVEGSQEIFVGNVIVKMLFADYTPMAYYEKKDSDYENITTALTTEEYLAFVDRNRPYYDQLYIAVRAEYWDSVLNKTMYEIEGNSAVVPYDNIGDDMYKLLQIYSMKNTTDAMGATRDTVGAQGMDLKYLVKVTNIKWKYDQQTSRLISESFTLSGINYASDLLQITLR